MSELAPPFPQPYLSDFDTVELAGGRACLPFAFTEALQPNTIFTPFGFTGDLAAGDTSFLPGWRIVAPRGDVVGDLHAMWSGNLRLQFVPGAPNSYRLILVALDSTLLSALKHLRPSWFPEPQMVLYENVDFATLATILKSWNDPASPDHAPERIADNIPWLTETGPGGVSEWEDYIDAFLAVDAATPLSSFSLVVEAGALIAQAGAKTGEPTKVEARVLVGMPFDLASWEAGLDGGLYVNPGYYVRDWPTFFGASRGETATLHALWGAMSTPQWAPFSNGVFRFVAKTGVSGDSEPFTSPARPASRVGEALARAGENDTVVILDTGTYQEDELLIDKTLTLCSVVMRPAVEAWGEDPTVSPFPVVDGSGLHRVLTVAPAAVSGPGVVCLHRIAIQHGSQDVDSGDGYLGGGGLLVKEWDRTFVSDCWFSENETTQAEPPSIAIRQFLLDALPEGTARDAVETSFDDWAETFGWGDTIANSGLLAHGLGAAACLIDSSAWLQDTVFVGNTGTDRGGALASAGLSWPVVSRNIFDGNASSPATYGRSDGGAFAAVVGLPTASGWELRVRDMLDRLVEFLNSLSRTQIADYALLESWTTLYTDIVAWIRGRWFDDAGIAQARVRHLVLCENLFQGNEALDDGGAIYLSILAQTYLKQNTIQNNHARTGNGGGLRATMSANLIVDGGTFTGNESNSDLVLFGNVDVDATGCGGGGLSMRNIRCELRSVSITGNTAHAFAGGGLYVIASDEGDYFHAILVDVFGFTDATLDVKGWCGAAPCPITGNAATRETDQVENHGKGGGLYLFRHNLLRVPTLTVSVEQYLARVNGNSGSVAGAEQFTWFDEAGELPETTSPAPFLNEGTLFISSTVDAAGE